jgi:hypothetical protein
MKPIIHQKDTVAWVVQVWISFLISVGGTTAGIIYLPVENLWAKGAVGAGYLFSLSSAFTLAKTIRDNQEANRLNARIEEAKVEKILAEHTPLI